MHERQQPGEAEPKPEARQAPSDKAGWDPNEQVGDIYSVELEPGHPAEIRKLVPETPRVWIGSWLDYNHGVLHGQWLDADREADELSTDIAAMLAASPTARQLGEVAEDWGIFDYEGFGDVQIDEQEQLEVVARIACGVAEHGLAFAAWVALYGSDPEVLGRFSDAHLGGYESVEAYVEQMVADLGHEELLDRVVPDSLRAYVQIDVAALARDMQLSGELHAIPADDGGVWLFDGRG